MTLGPKNFTLATNTVWSFKSRGNWATHTGNYRGNWSPYIPRNVVSRYSKEKDLVLDCFCGAGTTGVECKLTNRNFIGIDINPEAIELSKKNIDFPIFENFLKETNKSKIIFKVGDARELSFIEDESIDLICTHPPYSDIIYYTDNKEHDLSFLDLDNFLIEMTKVAKENYRVLKNNKYCAVLIGDMRKNKNVVPLGFKLINVYLNSGFSLKELIIKRQHNCKTTGFWYKNSIKYNFLLLAHEYLAIFKKQDFNPKTESLVTSRESKKFHFEPSEIKPLESSTVWIFDAKDWYSRTIQNLINRYNGDNYFVINKAENIDKLSKTAKSYPLIILNYIDQNFSEDFCDIIKNTIKHVYNAGYLAIICNDIRVKDGNIEPVGIEIERILQIQKNLKIKEIVIISLENNLPKTDDVNLNITHKYLFIYQVDKNERP
jgi:DNA modification methylase